MRLYTHTHTSVLKNRKKEKQEEVESINVADNLLKENKVAISTISTSTNYGNNTTNKENCINNSTKTNNKTEKEEQTNKKKIKKEEDKLQEVSCLLVMRKMAAVVIFMIIVTAILVCFRIKYNWKIGDIVEKIGKVINIKGTSADIEEVAAMDMTKVDLVPDAHGVNVPVPKGYVLSGASDENVVFKGAVIYEGTTAVTDSNEAEAKLTRNQFVWVPVSAANVSRIYSEDAYGRKTGKLYDYSSNGRTENTKGFEPYVSFIDIDDYVEADDEKYFQQYNVYGYTRNKFYEEMQKNYEQTIESIKIYGGFYIGRYETGNLSQRKPVCVQYNTDIYGQSWYTVYNKAQYLGKSASVKSMMIYGSLWDEVLMRLIETGEKTNREISEDSGDWGNYTRSFFNYYATAGASSTSDKGSYKILPTGVRAGSSSDGWKRNCANNIYDLAGNVNDLTQESLVKTDNVRARGGYYYYEGFKMPAGHRENWEKTQDNHYIGCRVCLIIT